MLPQDIIVEILLYLDNPPRFPGLISRLFRREYSRLISPPDKAWAWTLWDRLHDPVLNTVDRIVEIMLYAKYGLTHPDPKTANLCYIYACYTGNIFSIDRIRYVWYFGVHRELLEILFPDHDIFEVGAWYQFSGIHAAILFGQFDVFKHLMQDFSRDPRYNDLILVAAQNNRLQMLEYFFPGKDPIVEKCRILGDWPHYYLFQNDELPEMTPLEISRFICQCIYNRNIDGITLFRDHVDDDHVIRAFRCDY